MDKVTAATPACNVPSMTNVMADIGLAPQQPSQVGCMNIGYTVVQVSVLGSEDLGLISAGSAPPVLISMLNAGGLVDAL